MEYDEVVESGQKYLLLFYAQWAPPSLALKERLEGHNRFPVFMIDVEESPKTTLDRDVRAVPTLFFMQSDEVLKRRIGYDPDETLDFLEEE